MITYPNKMKPLWGIDLGGTKIEGVILEERDEPNVLKRLRVATEAHKGYWHILRQIGKLVEVLIAETGIRPDKIGFGTPGALDPHTGLMKNCNTIALNGQPLKKDLEKMLRLPVALANDANCFAVAETNMGAVQDVLPDAEVVFGVIMGTGVGGGVVINGRVRNGRQGIAGEWGHIYLDDSGGSCYCGNTGCVENVISGPATEAYYQNLTNTRLKLPQILERYHRGKDEAAIQTIQRLIHFFGKGIANVINILDPDVIVLGGGLSNIDLLYIDGVEEAKKFVFNSRLDTLFLRPKLGDSAGVFGAAFL